MDFKSELIFDPITPKYQPIMDGLEHSKDPRTLTHKKQRKKSRSVSLPKNLIWFETSHSYSESFERSSNAIKIMGTKEESELFLTNQR